MNAKHTFMHKGSTLVMGMLIMFFVIAVAAAIAMSLNSRTRISRFSTAGIVSQYVSESTMELAMMTIAQARFNRTTFDATSTALNNIGSLSIPFTHGGTVEDVTVEKGTSQFETHLRRDETVSVDLVKSGTADLSPPLDRMRLTWEPIDAQERIEVAWFGLNASEQPKTGRTFLTTSEHTGATVVFGFDDAFGYRVTIRSLESGVNHLVLEPQDQTGAAIDLEPAFTFQATGVFSGSEWTKQLVAPYRAPATNLLQYVIFSDEALEKPVR